MGCCAAGPPATTNRNSLSPSVPLRVLANFQTWRGRRRRRAAAHSAAAQCRPLLHLHAARCPSARRILRRQRASGLTASSICVHNALVRVRVLKSCVARRETRPAAACCVPRRRRRSAFRAGPSPGPGPQLSQHVPARRRASGRGVPRRVVQCSGWCVGRGACSARRRPGLCTTTNARTASSRIEISVPCPVVVPRSPRKVDTFR